MLPLKLKTSGNFTRQLEERIAKWSGNKISAVIQTPPELAYVYYTEWGTAAEGLPPFASGHSYVIVPVSAKALAFPGADGTLQIRTSVDHPGIRPRRSVTKALPAIREASIKTIDEAFQAGAADDPAILRAAVVEAVTQAKGLITASLAENVPGTRTGLGSQDGKLHGATAASVFDAAATVVDSSQ